MAAPAQRTKAIIAAYRSGRLLTDIGAKYGITRQRVSEILRRHGEPRRPPLDRQKAIAQVLRLLQQGHSFRASAGIIGIDEGTIRRWRRHSPELDAACKAAQDSATAARKADFLRLIGQGMPVRTAASATAGCFLLRR
jgi:hypothetical protein